MPSSSGYFHGQVKAHICWHQRNSVVIFFVSAFENSHWWANSKGLVLQSFSATDTDLTIWLDDAAALVKMFVWGIFEKCLCVFASQWQHSDKCVNCCPARRLRSLDTVQTDSPVYDAGTVTTRVTVGCILPGSIW